MKINSRGYRRHWLKGLEYVAAFYIGEAIATYAVILPPSSRLLRLLSSLAAAAIVSRTSMPSAEINSSGIRDRQR